VTPGTTRVTREQVLAFRVRASGLERLSGTLEDTSVLDLGVQDTGPDGALWALRIRGLSDVAQERLATVWTIRGAPHVYRRADLAAVAGAVAPFSEADAGKRIYDAAKPLKAAGIRNLDALDTVAAVMRRVVTEPMVKGEVSSRVTTLVDEPFLRFCHPCNATHLYEMLFRLAALPAGLELQPGTSPPVLAPIPGFQPSTSFPVRLDPVRGYLRLLGPATPHQVAAYLEAPVKDVRARWPEDAVPVTVDGERRWVLSADLEPLRAGPARATRLLGPFDLYLQARDHDLLVPDKSRARYLWPTLGRPGGVLADGEVVGGWRPRRSGQRLTVHVELWGRVPPTAIEEQAERLAAHRGLRLAGVELD
jgi:hypothetical protein